MRRFSGYWFFVLLITSCTRDVGVLPRGGYPPEIGRIITNNCATAGCHTQASREVAGGINLESWSALFEGSNTGSPVIPYSSRFSPLMYFVNTYSDLGVSSEPTMPLNRQPLSREQVTALRNWIDKGAPDANDNVMWSDDPLRAKLYVANQGCDVVTVMDAATRLPIRAIGVGTSPANDYPHQVRVSPDGNYWYVIFINSNFMQKFRTSDDSYVGDIPLTPYAAGSGDASQDAIDWNAFAISEDGKRAYCSSTSSGKVAAVDLEKLKFIRWIGGQHAPHGIVLGPTGDRLFVTAQTGNFIIEMDTGFTMSNQIPLQGFVNYSSSLDIHEALVSPGGGELILTCQKTNEVMVLDLVTRTVKATVQTGTLPQEIVYSPSTNCYYVSCVGDTSGAGKGVVTEIKDLSYSARHLSVGYQPHGLAVNPANGELVVASRNLNESGVPPHHGSICNGRNGFISFVDLNDFKLKPGTFELSVDPYYIFARP